MRLTYIHATTCLMTLMVLLLSANAQSQNSTMTHKSYVLQLDRWGSTTYLSLELDEHEGHINGYINRDPFTGVRIANDYIFTATARDQTSYSYR